MTRQFCREKQGKNGNIMGKMEPKLIFFSLFDK